MSNLTPEEEKVIEQDLEQLNDARQKVEEWLDNLTERRMTLPVLVGYIDHMKDSMDKIALHDIYKHGENPVVAVNNALAAAFARLFLMGLILGKQGFEPAEMPFIEEQDPRKSNWN